MGRTSDARQRLMNAAMALIWGQSYGSVTIDAICEKAKVKKGSFYYFFDSKSDLAVEALQCNFEERKPQLDTFFSPTIPPLDRLKNYFEFVLKNQAEMKRCCGHILGCPVFTLGCEICTQDQRIRKKVDDLMQNYIKYFESAIRDAQGLGLVQPSDSHFKAKCLFAYFEGALTQARISNDLDVLRDLARGAIQLLGAKAAKSG